MKSMNEKKSEIEILKERLFFRTWSERVAYVNMTEDDTYTQEEKHVQFDRFTSLWQVIEEANAEEAYEKWLEETDRY